MIDSQDSCFSFLSRSIPFFPVTAVEITPNMQKMVVIEAPFVEELSGMGHNKDFGHERSSHKHDQTKIH